MKMCCDHRHEPATGRVVDEDGNQALTARAAGAVSGRDSVWWPEHERRRRATESRGSGYQRTVGRKPRPDATPEERRRWGTGMVPGSVARNKGLRVSAEQVTAQRDKARRKREDDWPTGKAKPARLGETIEPAGMSAWVRDD